MTEERENTREVKFSVWETDWSDYVGDALEELMTKFDVFDANKEPGHFKVTIEFYPDTETEDEAK